MRVEVAVGQVPCRGELVDGRSVQIGGLLGDRAGPPQRAGRPQPAEPQPGGHDLGEGPEQHDPVADLLVGRDPRHPLALEAEFAVRVVLDDPQPAPRGHGRDGGPALRGHGPSGRVLEGGHGVEQLGPLLHHQLLQRDRIRTLPVPRHGHHPGTGEPEGLKCRQITGTFDEDGVPGLKERGGEQRQRLLRPGGDEEIVRLRYQPPNRHPRREGRPQHGLALGGRVLERPLGHLLQDRAEGGRDPLGVEQFGRRQPAREVEWHGSFTCGLRTATTGSSAA